MRRVIDLSHTYEEGFPGFMQEQAKKLGTDGWNATTLHIYSHSGTHMDAPVHVEINNTGIDRIPVERFVCNCHIIRLSGIQPGQLITPEMLGDIRSSVREGEGIILNTGWSRYIHDKEMFRNRLPRISRELALWLKDRKVNLVGVEPPSVADVNNRSELYDIHCILLGAGILIIEGLTNLESIEQNTITLIVLPLKIKDGDGSPVRAIAIEE